MPIGTKADFRIYQDEFFAGMYETLQTNINVFNGASNGAITLSSELLRGDFDKQAFMRALVNSEAVARRDPTSVAPVTDSALLMGEVASIKLNRRFGPYANTIDQWKKIAKDPGEFSVAMGRLFAEQKTYEMLNAALVSLEASIGTVAALGHTIAANGTMTHSALVSGMSKMGDKADNIVCWVMHSKPWFDLIQQSLTDKIFGVANITVFQGLTGTLGKPVIVTDMPSLLNAGTPDLYVTLGLTAGAATVRESEMPTVESQLVTGLANLVMRIQGEYAYNLGVKGFTWDLTNGGLNPDNTALALGTNWDKVATDNKQLAGVRIISG
jgi:hypothetical protein